MSNESLAAWKTDTAVVLLSTLPLQTLESATVLVDDYLAANGGWIPDDAGDPTGPGAPATGETAPEAANSITQEQLERVYDTRVTVNVDLDLHIVQNLDPGLSEQDVLVLIQETIESTITEQLACTRLELNSLNESSGITDQGGNTTAEQRVAANDAVESGDILVDPVSISLSLARQRFDLDDRWNVTFIYNEPDQDIVAQVERYTDTTYETLDIFTVTQHIVTIDNVSFKLASGVSKTRPE